MDKIEIGNLLKELRKKNNLTQSELAKRLNIANPSTVGSWEIGKSEPSLGTFKELCRIYGIHDISEVFPDLDSPLKTKRGQAKPSRLMADIRLSSKEDSDAGTLKENDDSKDALRQVLTIKLSRLPSLEELILTDNFLDSIVRLFNHK